MSIRAAFRLQKGNFCLAVDTHLPDAGVTAIFGPSGCGKTSLLRCIAGLERPEEGFLQVGQQIWQAHGRFVPTHRRAIGYVFQSPGLFEHLDVAGNLRYGQVRARTPSTTPLSSIIARLGIGHLLRHRPWQLSGGEQQRVAIARALASNPALLLMDEPLSALDEKRRNDILPWLDNLHRNLDIPVLYVTHARDEVARMADHLVLMQNGCIQDSGPVQSLFARTDLPMAHQSGAVSLIETRVLSYEARYRLNWLAAGAYRLALSGPPLTLGQAVRVQVAARDVSITLGPQQNTSITNILPAQVDTIAKEPEAQALVRLRLAPDMFLLARLTQKSVDNLDLKPGCQVFAQVKTIALV